MTQPGAPGPQEARRALEAARQALLRGDQGEARRMARMAARLFPTWDAPWLLLAAVSAQTILLLALAGPLGMAVALAVAAGIESLAPV